MKRILYLGSNKSMNDFDYLQEDNVLHKVEKDRLTDEEFSKLVKTELRNVDQDYLILDVRMFEQEVLSYREGIETFQILNQECQVILYDAEGSFLEDEIINNVIVIQEPFYESEDNDSSESEVQEPVIEVPRDENIDVDNPAKEQEEQKKEIKDERNVLQVERSYDLGDIDMKVKTNEGMPLRERCMILQRKDAASPKKLTCLNNVWTCSNVIIAVVGTQRRTGTTTTAIRLCNYLDACGAKVCYSEAVLDGNKHLESIAEEFGFQVLADGYRKENIMFFLESQYDTESGYNFIILDLGAVDERSKWISAVLEQIADEVIVVSSGSRKYEVDCLKQSIEALSGLTIRINIVLNLVNENELEKFLEYQENERVVLHQGQHEPGLFVSTRTEEEIVRVLSEHNV